MSTPRWWTVEPDKNGSGWVVTNGAKRIRFAPGRDIEARDHADRLNGARDGSLS